MAYLKPDKPEKVYVPALRSAKRRTKNSFALRHMIIRPPE